MLRRLASEEEAEAEKMITIKRAEGDAESKRLQGEGIAQQRQAIVDGLEGSVKKFNAGIAGTTPADVMQLMLTTQYLVRFDIVIHCLR